VVCPASVQINWLNETAKHSHLTAYSLHGSERDRAARRWLREGGVAVTTFGTLARLPTDVRTAGVAMLIVDEAHFVKNSAAARSQAVARAARDAQRVLFLTGTPTENRVEEFRNLVGYVQPQVARRVDASDALAGARAFRRAVAPVYLRRNQEDVLTELPEKIEVEDWVRLSAADEQAYTAAVGARNLMQMRQAAYLSSDSAKLGRLREICEEAAEDGLKVVVFSFFLGVLETVGRALGPTVVGTVNGSVPPAVRQQLVDEFTRRSGHAVLLGQIEAGGVGINMQAASVVILTEPQWKPSTEQQARRPRAPDGTGSYRPGAPPPREGQRRRADARDPGEQDPAVRRVRAQKRRQGG
jgi:SNF2 family DNA or RNA helicase